MNNHVMWKIGFRPFFLFGSMLSVGLVFFWAISFFTGNLPGGFFDPIVWHAHEMIFGFGVAIVAGFLLTASANWTQSAPVADRKLKLVFGLWLLGRLAFLTALFDYPFNPWSLSVVDLLFLPSLIWALAPHLLKSKQLRNIQFLIILSLLTLGNLLIHLASHEAVEFIWATRSIYLAVHLILIVMVIIGGRVIPFFTENAKPEVRPKRYLWVEKLSLLSVWAFVALDFFFPDHPSVAYVALVAGLCNCFRLWGWRAWRTWDRPLLWILHIGYLWIALGLLLISASDLFGVLPRSSAVHSFTTGAMGTFIIGMMSRVTLGHTGRPLKLKRGFIFAYIFIILSGLLRVGAGFSSDYYEHGILCSGIFWALSYLMYVFYYFKILIEPRPDGRPG